MMMLWLLLPPPLVAVQVMVLPLVSALTVTAVQPLWLLMADSVSTTLQVTLTSLVYQSLLPSVPATVGVMTGGVLSRLTVTTLSVLLLGWLP